VKAQEIMERFQTDIASAPGAHPTALRFIESLQDVLFWDDEDSAARVKVMIRAGIDQRREGK
jgi:hypothetical protein